VRGECRRLYNKNFILCTAHQISVGWWSQDDWDGQGMKHV
jgi:hypothetical protein